MKQVYSRKNWQQLFLACLLTLMASCVGLNDPQWPLYYKVQNNTSFEIKVIYNDLGFGYYYSGHGIKVPDSVILIEPGGEKSLFLDIYDRSDRINPEKADTIQAFHTLRIYKNDTILSTKYYLLTQYWEYYEPNRNEAELTLAVSPGDFEQ